MKQSKYIFIILIMILGHDLYGQSSGLVLSTSGDPSLNESAILELIANDKGILIPRLSSVERDDITVGATKNGLLIYNTDNSRFEYYNHSVTSWLPVYQNADAVLGLVTKVKSHFGQMVQVPTQ